MRIIDGNSWTGYLDGLAGATPRRGQMMTTEIQPNPVVPNDRNVLEWLALALTPGVGAGRGRKLVEAFDGVGRLFTASLTELEAAGVWRRGHST